MDLKELEVRYIAWLDSSGLGHWESVNNLKKLGPDQCASVGFVFRETDDVVVLTQGFTSRGPDEPEMGDNSIAIPKFAITESVTLRKGRIYVD